MNSLSQFLFDPSAIGDTRASWSIVVLIVVTMGSCASAMLFGWSYRRHPILSWTGFSALISLPVVVGLYFRSQALTFQSTHSSSSYTWWGYFWVPFFFAASILLIALLIATGLVKVGGKYIAQPIAAADRERRGR
jgi:hypothetical protein